MGTRYFEMMSWGIQYFVFSLSIILLYYGLDKTFKPIRIRLNHHHWINIYIQDFFLVFILVLIVGIRCNNGSDYYNYWTMYTEVNSWYSNLGDILDDRFQNGYILICYIVKLLGGGKYAIFGVVAILIYFPTIWIFRKYSRSPVLSFACWVLLGYLAMSANILKQSLAMTCILVAFFYWINQKYVSFTILAILGCMFHLSMIYVLIVIMLLNKITPSWKMYYGLIFLGLLLCAFLESVLIALSATLSIRYVDLYIQDYLNGNLNDVKLELGGMLVALFYIFVLGYMMKKYYLYKVGVTIIDRYILVLSIMCIPFLVLGVRFYLLNRIAYSGLLFLTILIPKYCDITKEYKRFYVNQIYILALMFSFLFTILCAENNYYQYSTIYCDTPVSVSEFVRRINK